jgi:hypothetical protein
MGQPEAVEGLRELEDLADLGLPVARTRFGRLKRIVTRLCWVFLHRQVAYNHEVARSIDGLAAEVAQAIDRSADQARTLGELRQRFDQIEASRARGRDDEREQLEEALGNLRESVVQATDAAGGAAG